MGLLRTSIGSGQVDDAVLVSSLSLSLLTIDVKIVESQTKRNESCLMISNYFLLEVCSSIMGNFLFLLKFEVFLFIYIFIFLLVTSC